MTILITDSPPYIIFEYEGKSYDVEKTKIKDIYRDGKFVVVNLDGTPKFGPFNHVLELDPVADIIKVGGVQYSTPEALRIALRLIWSTGTISGILLDILDALETLTESYSFNDSISNNNIIGSATRISSDSNPCYYVVITASINNTNSVTIGNSSVVYDEGIILHPGFSIGLKISDTNLVYAAGPDAGPYQVTVQYFN